MITTEHETAMTAHHSAAAALEGVFGRVMERMRTNVHIGLACGEPRTIGETTIIPIGMVGYGFGFGLSPRAATDGAGCPLPGGYRGGGGGGARPIALVMITGGQARVVPLLDWTRVITVAISVAGKLLVRRGVQSRLRGSGRVTSGRQDTPAPQHP